MTKQAFLDRLRKGLCGLPQEEVEEYLIFYAEMIDDRIEEGHSEEEAVAAIGSIDEIIANIIADIPLTKIAKERIIPKRKLKVWEVVLLALGSPIWLSLLIAACAAIFSLYVASWSVIVSLWAVFIALIACVAAPVINAVIFTVSGNIVGGIAMFGFAIASLGLSVFLYYGCKAVTTAISKLTKSVVVKLKSCFVKKEEA